MNIDLRLFKIICLMMLLLPQLAFAEQKMAELSADATYMDLSPHLMYLGDRDQDLTINDLLSSDAFEWFKNEGTYLRWGNDPRKVWYRIEVDVGQVDDKNWVFHSPSTNVYYADVYIVSNKKIINHYTVSSENEFSRKPILVNDHALPFEAEENSQLEIYFWTTNTPDSHMPLSIKTLKYFNEIKRSEFMVLGAMIGVFLVMALYNLFLFVSLREFSYLYYSLFLSSGILVYISMMGLGFEYIWPDSPNWNRHALLFFSSVAYCFASLFVSSFLDLRLISRHLLYYFNGVAVLFLMLMGVSVFSFYSSLLEHTVLIGKVAAFLTTLASLSYVGAGAYAWWKGSEFAKYYVFAWALFCSVMIYIGLAFVGLIPMNYMSIYLVIASSCIEMVLISFALAARIKKIRDESIKATARDQAKSLFLAKVTHDLKNPMMAAIACNEMLREKLNDEKDLELNELVINSTKELLKTVDEILDFTKMESGNLSINPETVCLNALAREVVAVCRPLADERSIDLIFDENIELPAKVLADPLRIKQIIFNYIANAIKFTREGYVKLRIEQDADNEKSFSLNVYDTGIGVSDSDTAKLFQSFSQANNPESQGQGHGLGLLICKQLAELMGGEVGCSSVKGEGSHFWAKLNFEPAV